MLRRGQKVGIVVINVAGADERARTNPLNASERAALPVVGR